MESEQFASNHESYSFGFCRLLDWSRTNMPAIPQHRERVAERKNFGQAMRNVEDSDAMRLEIRYDAK